MYMEIKHTVVGDVSLITLENDNLKVVTTNYGAALFHIYVKDQGQLKEVSVQPEDLDEFLTSSFYYGKTVGRTAGRLFLPSYDIGLNTYVLPDEGKPSFIHGGTEGYSFKHFEIMSYSAHDVTFKATSYAEEGPYDGDMTLEVRYIIEGDTLSISFKAETTDASLCNITNHIYLNLSHTNNIYDHQVEIDADHYLHIDATNKFISKEFVTDAFDFRVSKPLDQQLQKMENTPFEGFDHTFLLNKLKDYDMKVSSQDFAFELKTTYPAVVLYTHNNLAPYSLRNNESFDNKHVAFTVECQFEPGGIQVEGLNDAVLNIGDVYEHSMHLQFKKIKS
jgi:aldose 1-epimerase